MKNLKEATNNPVYINNIDKKIVVKVDKIAKKNKLSKSFIYNRLLETALNKTDPLDLGLKR